MKKGNSRPADMATRNKLNISSLEATLSSLRQQHIEASAENTRLKTRLGVVEALLPVCVMAEEQAPDVEEDAVLARLLDSAASGPSSCGTNCWPRRASSLGPLEHRDEESGHSSGCSAELGTDSGSPGAAGGCGAGDGDGAIAGGASNLPVALNTASPDAASPDAGCGYLGLVAERRSEWQPRSPQLPQHQQPHQPLDSGRHMVPPQHLQQEEAHRQQPQQPKAAPQAYTVEDATVLWVETWGVWVREAALMSEAYQARPHERYIARIDAAFEKVCAEGARLWHPLGFADIICGAHQTNMETGVRESPPDSHWVEVARGMQLTSEQVSACRAALALYRERMEVVMAQRRSLTDRLAACMSALRLAEAEVWSAFSGSMEHERLSLEVREVTVALDANVAAEGRATRLARELLRSNILTSLQRARGAVLSYPYFPDAFAMLAAMVGEAEAPGQEQEQQRGSRLAPPSAQA